VVPMARSAAEEPGPRARRQLGRVLLILGALDLSVVVYVLGVVVAAPSLGLANWTLLFAILGGIGAILGLRVWLAVRLRRRSGELF